MAKIDLNRERGVRVTNKPSGGLDYNFGGVYAGINAQQKANDALAKGMNHVGRVLTGIYDDMAATRNRQETLAGETAYFDIQEQTNQKILQQIEAGEFDGAGGQDKFREACEKAQNANNERFLKWCDKNASTDEVQDMLILRSKQADARNFAHLGGVMARHAVHLTRTTAEDGIARGIENMDKGLVRLWVDSLEEVESPELREARKLKAFNQIDRRAVELRISEGNSIVNAQQQEKHFEALYNDLQSGKYDGLYKSQIKKFVADINKGLNSGEYRSEIRQCSAMMAKDLTEMSSGQFDEWEKQSVAEINAKEHLSDEEKEFYREKVSARRRSLQRNFVENAQAQYRDASMRLLESAYKDDRGDVDLNYDFVGGQMREAARRKIDAMQDAYFSDGEAALKYDRDFHSVMSDISSYKNEKDKDGMELRSLLFRTQEFSREHRKLLINALYGKANGRVPDKWSTESWDSFGGQIDEMFEWYDVKETPSEEKVNMAEDSRSVAFYQMRNSIMADVEKLGLTPLQAQEYLQKHPVYKRLRDKQSYADAVGFLTGFTVKPVEDRKNSNQPQTNLSTLWGM